MTRVAGLVLAALACAGQAALAQAPAPPTARVVRAAGATGWIAKTDDRIVSSALPRTGDAQRVVALLTVTRPPEKPAVPAGEPAPCDPLAESVRDAEDKAPRRLAIFEPRGEGRIRVVREGLPADTREIAAADLDGDGRDELLLAHEGEIAVLRDDGSGSFASGPETLLPLPRLAHLAPGATGGGAGVPSSLWLATLGRLGRYGPQPDGTWGLHSEFAVPLSVAVSNNDAGLLLSSPEILALQEPGAATFFATRPAAEFERGVDRIGTTIVRAASGGAFERIESWCRLPARERVLESALLRLDDRPVLAVTTARADKLSFFGEKALRVCALEADRTRAGRPAAFAVETRINLWQEAFPVALDVDGDGRRDLVLAYWKGLKDDTLVLDAYLRRADGGFDKSPRSTTFDVEDADREFIEYGTDLDGDARGDLLVESAGRLLLYPGLPPAGGRRLVDVTPRFSIAIASTGEAGEQTLQLTLGPGGATVSASGAQAGTPRLTDLDGDGVPEILIEQLHVEGRSVVAVVHADRTGP